MSDLIANLILLARDLKETDDIRFLLYEWRETLAFERAEPDAVRAIQATIKDKP